MVTQRQLDAAARRLHRLLQQLDQRIVFAESCTGGLVSATLARIPGISAYLCGSAVVYQNETKANWLGISAATLEVPGPVSSRVAKEMAQRVLEKTPQAQMAASITGHLGPDAPLQQDGLVYVAIAVRQPIEPASQGIAVSIRSDRLGCAGEISGVLSAVRIRRSRQRQAAHLVLTAVCERLVEATVRDE